MKAKVRRKAAAILLPVVEERILSEFEEKARPLRVLSLHGGGYLGLATAAFLAEAERRSGRRCADAFDLFCGTSTGAVLALGLATGRSAHELVDLYRGFGPKLFPASSPSKPRAWLSFARNALRAKYSPAALADALDDEFGQTTLSDILARGKFVLVPAFCLTNGAPRIFKTDHGGLSAHGEYRLTDVALASSAAPTYFPVHSIVKPTTGVPEDFCDGGVFANDPSMLGYVEAVKYLGWNADNVQVLSVSTPRTYLGRRRPMKYKDLGFFGWGFAAPPIFIDGSAKTTHHILRHVAELNGSMYKHVELDNRSSSGAAVSALDDASDAATEALMMIGTEAAETLECDEALAPYFQAEERS